MVVQAVRIGNIPLRVVADPDNPSVFIIATIQVDSAGDIVDGAGLTGLTNTNIKRVTIGSLESAPRSALSFTLSDQNVAIPDGAEQVWICYEVGTFYIALADTTAAGPELPAGGYMWPVGVGVGRVLHYRAKTLTGAGSATFLI